MDRLKSFIIVEKSSSNSVIGNSLLQSEGCMAMMRYSSYLAFLKLTSRVTLPFKSTIPFGPTFCLS